MNNIELKFIVDVGVSNKVEKWLALQGFDVVNVRDIDPRLPDYEIVKIATKENRMVITMDKDFGELVYRSNVTHTGVLLLRLDGYSSQEKVNLIKTILEEHQDKIIGKFCVYKDNNLRIR